MGFIELTNREENEMYAKRVKSAMGGVDVHVLLCTPDPDKRYLDDMCDRAQRLLNATEEWRMAFAAQVPAEETA